MTNNEHTTALITGANKGIGFATARQLLDLGWTVWVGSRDHDRGEKAVAELSAGATEDRVHLVDIDVTDDTSVNAAADLVGAEGGLDVLINNAGIAAGLTPPDRAVAADFLPTFGVNLLGAVRVTHAFLPILERSAHPRIVNVSSGMGSFAVTGDPERFESTLADLVYPASKAALNMVTTMTAKALSRYQVNAVDPGYTATDLNGHRGFQSVDEGASRVVRAATTTDGTTGAFFAGDGFIGW